MADKGIVMNEEGPVLSGNKGVNYLLAIAIDDYEHCPRLYNCVRDAGRLIEVLSDQYQFERQHVFTLFNEQATEHAIIDQFKKLVQLVQPEDNLIILFSGHGEYEEAIDEGYWIPVDAPLGHTNEYIANSRIIKYIRAIRAHHTFLIVDSCFSGSLFATRSLEQPAGPSRLDAIPSRWLLTAGRNEVVSDGKPGDHSPFADNVIYFLKHNQEPHLSVSTLIDQVVNAVIYNARQTPRGEPLQDVGHRGGQFHFYRKGHAPVRPAARSAERPATASPAPAKPQTSNYWKYGLAAIAVLAVVGFLMFRQSGKPAAAATEKKEQAASAREQLEQQARYDNLIAAGIERFQNARNREQYEAALEEFNQALRLAETAGLKAEAAERGIRQCREKLQALKEEKGQPERPAPDPVSPEARDWQQAKAAATEKAYRAYLRAHPKGRHAEEAQAAIAAGYRYDLYFTTSLQQGNRLTINIGRGKAPFDITITYTATGETIRKKALNTQTVEIPLGQFNSREGKHMVEIVVRDDNFKAKGQKMPLMR